jgi:hypothetical protein
MNYMDLIVDQRKNSSVLSLGPVTDPTLPAMIEPLIASLNSAGVGIDSVLVVDAASTGGWLTSVAEESRARRGPKQRPGRLL